ncbi:MAG: hypothetical protein ACREP6_00490, partial [Candidatus Binataceae bacterium]
ISGGGVGKGGLIAFRDGAGQPIARSNKACLVCHDEAYWHGRTHGARPLACFDCHTIMERQSPQFQLSPALTTTGWSNARTWGGAAGGGAALGLIGAIGAIIFRRRNGGRRDRET